MLVALALGAAALLQRGEGWMFAAGLIAMLAQTLVVCHHFPANRPRPGSCFYAR